MSESSSLRVVKFLVVAMGVTMIVGVLFILVVIARTVNLEKGGDCASQVIDLPESAQIIQIVPEKKNRILVLLELEDKKQAVWVFNSCIGEIERRFDFR